MSPSTKMLMIFVIFINIGVFVSIDAKDRRRLSFIRECMTTKNDIEKCNKLAKELFP